MVRLDGELKNDPPAWVLNVDESYVLPDKWTFVFERTDTERLGMKTGTYMTCYLAVLDSLKVQGKNTGVTLYWKTEEEAFS